MGVSLNVFLRAAPRALFLILLSTQDIELDDWLSDDSEEEEEDDDDDEEEGEEGKKNRGGGGGQEGGGADLGGRGEEETLLSSSWSSLSDASTLNLNGGRGGGDNRRGYPHLQNLAPGGGRSFSPQWCRSFSSRCAMSVECTETKRSLREKKKEERSAFHTTTRRQRKKRKCEKKRFFVSVDS